MISGNKRAEMMYVIKNTKQKNTYIAEFYLERSREKTSLPYGGTRGCRVKIKLTYKTQKSTLVFPSYSQPAAPPHCMILKFTAPPESL